jgi:hypothetical protein
MVLAIAAGHAAPAGQDKEKPAEAPKEESVVAYDSQTHGAVHVQTVDAKPVDWFDVLQNGKRVFEGNPKLLNNTLELAPGTYVVEVNRTQRKVTIEAGKKTILWTGELVVEGQPPGAYWYPMQGKERKLASNPPLLNRPRALFPGTYTVFVHVSVTLTDKNLGEAEVKAGRKTVLKHSPPSRDR